MSDQIGDRSGSDRAAGDGPGDGRGPGEVARALIEATFAGDVEAATALCTPDVEVRIEGTQTVYGHEGLRHLIEFNTEVSTNVSVAIHHVLGSGNTAAVSRTTYLTIGGRDLALEVGAFLRLRDGLVCEWVDYQDMRIVTEALGH